MASLIRLGMGSLNRLIFQGYGLPVFGGNLVLARESAAGDSVQETALNDLTAKIIGTSESAASANSDKSVVLGVPVSIGDTTSRTGGTG